MTRHAATRSQQRGIPLITIDLLLQFGATESAGDGTSRYFFDKAARRQLRAYAGPLARAIAEHLDIYAIVASDSKVITVGHRLERVKRF
jgi:hypothetical protein